MSNELTRAGQAYLVKSSSGGLKRDAGKVLVGSGVASFSLWFLAGMLPFITFPMLMVAAVVLGVTLCVK